MSNNWLLTGDLNFPFTLMPTFLRVPSPDFAASLISIFPSLLMFHYSGRDSSNTIASPRLDSLEPNALYTGNLRSRAFKQPRSGLLSRSAGDEGPSEHAARGSYNHVAGGSASTTPCDLQRCSVNFEYVCMYIYIYIERERERERERGLFFLCFFVSGCSSGSFSRPVMVSVHPIGTPAGTRADLCTWAASRACPKHPDELDMLRRSSITTCSESGNHGTAISVTLRAVAAQDR